MVDQRPTRGTNARLTDEQREALWTWRWLGLRGSTPAFKASLVLLSAAALGLIVYWMLAA